MRELKFVEFESDGKDLENSYVGNALYAIVHNEAIKKVVNRTDVRSYAINDFKIRTFNLKDKENGNIHCLLFNGVLLWQDTTTPCDYKEEEVLNACEPYLYIPEED